MFWIVFWAGGFLEIWAILTISQLEEQTDSNCELRGIRCSVTHA